MSAPLKLNTPAPLTSKCNWARVTTDELKSSLDDEPEIYDMKVGECKQCRQAKKEAKEKEAREHQQREEAERWAREEAVHLKREAATIQRQEEADRRVREERQAKEEKERQEREAVVRQEAVIKKATEMAEQRAQEDMEEKQAEAVKKIRVAEEAARQCDQVCNWPCTPGAHGLFDPCGGEPCGGPVVHSLHVHGVQDGSGYTRAQVYLPRIRGSGAGGGG